jgi:hypothetical protein
MNDLRKPLIRTQDIDAALPKAAAPRRAMINISRLDGESDNYAMSWSNVNAFALSLGGVLLGTLGTLSSQYLMMRMELRRDTGRKAEVMRDEKKAAINDFLKAA